VVLRSNWLQVAVPWWALAVVVVRCLDVLRGTPSALETYLFHVHDERPVPPHELDAEVEEKDLVGLRTTSAGSTSTSTSVSRSDRRRTPSTSAVLVLGLVLYMAAFIAEIVRGSILSVPKGQSEAANALGLSGLQRLRYVLVPQALRVAIPPTGNEYLNTAKNSALGVLIAFPETLRVARIAIGNGYPAPQLLGIMLVFFLTISLVLAVLTNTANWLVQRKGRR
jgi:ABC-type amino acid transport system permease subunit